MHDLKHSNLPLKDDRLMKLFPACFIPFYFIVASERLVIVFDEFLQLSFVDSIIQKVKIVIQLER